MSDSSTKWKKGRGKLGVFEPLLGTWRAEADTSMGKVTCTRTFSRVLGGAYIQLAADWVYAGETYQEIGLFGTGANKAVHFWSFTSDKKQASGVLSEGSDLHPQALCFEAQMDAGLARQAYLPDGQGGFFWVVESKTKKGWNRFVEHHYQRVSG